MVKPIWKGSLSFGLVSIPICLYSAIKEHVLSFKNLHSVCHTPIVYKRWCNTCHKEVPWQEVVKGFKQPNGSYVILTQEKIRALKPSTTDTISIIEFVRATAVNPLYLENHFYIGPAKDNEKAFYLFKAALEKTGMVAIGRFVMREKEYVCVINPYQTALLLSTLNYAYEIRSLKEVPHLKEPKKLESTELSLAVELIGKSTRKFFAIEDFKDTFAQQLTKKLKRAKKEKVPKLLKETPGRVKKEKTTSLAVALKASLGAHGKAKSAKKRK